MPVFGTSSTIQLDTIVFATDFSPAAHNAGLYASAISVRFGTKLVVVHGFTLLQPAMEAEAFSAHPSVQRRELDHDLTLVAKNLDAGQGVPEAFLLQGDPRKVVPEFARSRHRFWSWAHTAVV